MTDEERDRDEAAFRRDEADLPNRYPHMQFVAYGKGEILADDSDFQILFAKLKAMGWDPQNVLIVRVGDEPPQNIGWPGWITAHAMLDDPT